MLELCINDFSALGTALNSISQVADPSSESVSGLGYVRLALEHPGAVFDSCSHRAPLPDPAEIHKRDPTEMRTQSAKR